MPTHQELPELFGRYRIFKKLGAGGMGAVYLAEDTRLRRKVALKVPHFTPRDGEAVLERFRREARLAAGIDHPNFCPVHDVDEIDGIHYFTMTYVEGTPLANLIAEGQSWPPAQAVDMVRRVALAVGELHSRGIIHRDLKPANIMVRPSGEPVLMDFGLACSLTSQTERLTGTGEVLGTPTYIAPEQLEGDRARLTPAADVYSLGMILYPLLTGRVPFSGPLLVVVAQVRDSMPESPSTLQHGLDPRLDAICRKALAKKPEERFPDMYAFVTALEEVLDRSGEQRLSCPQCGKGLKVPPSMAGEKMKYPQCGASLATPGTTTVAEPRPRPIPVHLETVPPSGRETAVRPPRLPWAVGRRRVLVLLTLLGVGIGIVLAAVLRFRSSRDQGTPEAKPPDKQIVLPAALPDKFVNTVQLQMVRIKKGTFRMGALASDKNKSDNELAQHLVKITRDLGATEVTRRQFKRFVLEENYKTEAERAGAKETWWNNQYSTEDEQPVVNVTWNDAMAFCKWLSEKEGKEYDLPTEAEWEYTCRAGGEPGDAYGFGNDETKLGDYAWYRGNVAGKTHPVGKKRANRWGLYDMHGNVWEWCKDGPRKYPDQETAAKQESPIEDPKDDLNGDSRVLRGGSWVNVPRGCRSAHRVDNPRAHRHGDIGFRVVLRPGERAP
jgi:formylglycine-generating enzyme required for sulfatase activity